MSAQVDRCAEQANRSRGRDAKPRNLHSHIFIRQGQPSYLAYERQLVASVGETLTPITPYIALITGVQNMT